MKRISSKTLTIFTILFLVLLSTTTAAISFEDRLKTLQTTDAAQKKDPKFKSDCFTLAKDARSAGQFAVASAALSEVRKVDYNNTDAIYGLVSIAWEAGDYNDVAFIGRKFKGSGKEQAAEVARLRAQALQKLKRYGQAVAGLNWAVRSGFMQQDEFYYENVAKAYRNMGASANSVYQFTQEGLGKFASNLVLLDQALEYSLVFNQPENTKKYASELEKLIYQSEPSTVEIARANIITNSTGLKQSDFKAYRSDLAWGRSKNRVELKPLVDQKLSKAGNAPKNQSFATFGMDIKSPVSGLVVAAYGAERDHKPGKPNFRSRGNYLIIMYGLGQFLYLSNLQYKSLKLSAGDYIQKGDVLAKVGNSGRYLFPSLALEYRNRSGFKGISAPVDVK